MRCRVPMGSPILQCEGCTRCLVHLQFSTPGTGPWRARDDRYGLYRRSRCGFSDRADLDRAAHDRTCTLVWRGDGACGALEIFGACIPASMCGCGASVVSRRVAAKNGLAAARDARAAALVRGRCV